MANASTGPKGKDEHRSNPTSSSSTGNTGQATMEKAKDFVSQVGDKAREAASSVGEMASNAASNVGKKAEDLTSSAGSSLRQAGESLSHAAPSGGMFGGAAQTVAQGLKQGGRYLEDAGLSGISEDVTNVIRRNPIPAVMIGIGLGFLLGRVLRS